jgi:signal transduction histidine kinase
LGVPKLDLSTITDCVRLDQKMAVLLRWLPLTGSVILMAIISIIFAGSFSQLKTSNFWRDHSYEVLATAKTLLSDLSRIQGKALIYAVTGNKDALEAFQESVNTQQLMQLKLLTRDNPGQQERLRPIGPELDEIIGNAQQLVVARDTEGVSSAVQFETDRPGISSMDRALADLQAFTDEERRLLNKRSAKAEVDLETNQGLLISWSVVAVLLLILANLMTNRALAKQKVLTGAARSAELAKSKFLAIMSHEIRTPMNGVIGMTSILADTELTEMQRDCLKTISSSGESLMTVINDILDFSKIESGRMELESRSFNVRDCVEEALDLFAAQIRIKGLEAVYLVAPDVPSSLIGDAMRLRQILVNLLGNAVKFTSQGEIAVNVDCKSQDQKGCHLEFSVTDTGIGISEEGIEKVFKSSQQVDTSTTRRYGGTGLGLVISRRLAEFRGGTIWVESQLGSGSTFFFSVVLKASEDPVPNHELAASQILVSLTALIVDDNTTNRRGDDLEIRMIHDHRLKTGLTPFGG